MPTRMGIVNDRRHSRAPTFLQVATNIDTSLSL